MYSVHSGVSFPPALARRPFLTAYGEGTPHTLRNLESTTFEHISRRAPPTAQGGGAPETLRLWLLGGFKLSVGSRSIGEEEWHLRKAGSLLKVLALSPGHRLHREQAMELLWPDLDPEAALNNLHYALHVARRTLEPAALASFWCETASAG